MLVTNRKGSVSAMQPPPVNSEGFWDLLFMHTWEARRGREQTAFFAKVALNHFPDWFMEELRSHSYSICDIGCALGDALPILGQAFPDSVISGIDFSQEAIVKAKKFFPEYSFYAEDILQMSNRYDILFSSNTLEHFHDPFPILHKLLQQTNKYLVLLLPFQDDTGTDEHFFRFDYEHFPEKIADCRLFFLKEIDCQLLADSYWSAKQVLVIYKKEGTHAGSSEEINTVDDSEK
jgi:O-antigen biosynthesis protein